MANNQYTKLRCNTIEDQTFESVKAHVLDPKKNPLPTKDMEDMFARIVTCAQMFDTYPEDRMLIKLMRVKYPNLSDVTLNRDIAYAKRLFVFSSNFDYDFWKIWQINDVLQLLRTAKQRNDLKMWNEAHKTLTKIIGEKPAEGQDLTRMQNNKFYIQINNGQQPQFVPIEDARDMSEDKLAQLISQSTQVISSEEELSNVFDS